MFRVVCAELQRVAPSPGLPRVKQQPRQEILQDDNVHEEQEVLKGAHGEMQFKYRKRAGVCAHRKGHLA